MVANVCGAALLLAALAGPPTNGGEAPALPPGNQARFLSLAEARALALEQGKVGEVCLQELDPVRVRTALAGGLLVVRARPVRARAAFERDLNQVLFEVEKAYWELYGAYFTLYCHEVGLRLADETWRLAAVRYADGTGTSAEYGMARGQYEMFRAQWLAGAEAVREGERKLRALLGLPVEDGTFLVPSDAAGPTAQRPDWEQAAGEALARRPELVLRRREVELDRLRWLVAKHSAGVVPCWVGECTLSVLFEPFGFRPIWADYFCPSKSIRDIFPGRLSTPVPGLMVLGPDLERPRRRLAGSMVALKDQELKTLRSLAGYYRQLHRCQDSIEVNRAQREAFGEQLRARRQDFRARCGTFDLLLEAQRFWAAALVAEHNEVVAANIALAGFAYAKGTI
jgi:hypothetical protein